jgi:hypothetical protein
MSLVQLHAPDFERFPRFRAALDAARRAELGPGDALFIPPLWWHNVEALDPLNVLVNYWWHASGARLGSVSGYDSLLHAILNIRQLPEPARAAWRSLFEHYVFGPQERVTAHIPEEKRGVLGPLARADAERVQAQLAKRLQSRK